MKIGEYVPSLAHRMLCDLIARKMREEGYVPVAFDGRRFMAGNDEVRVPPRIGRHRPDVLGYDPSTKTLCIGEAKTGNDLHSQRSKEQLTDYADIIGMSSGERVRLIIGVTNRMQQELLTALEELGLQDRKNISYILLPEELIGSDAEI